MKISKRESEVLQAIYNHLLLSKKLPSYRTLGKELGYDSSPQRVSYFIRQLKLKGFLVEGDEGELVVNHELADKYLEKSHNIDVINVPLLGTIPCGPTASVEECVEDTYQISTNIAKKGNQYFLLRATGDSMDKAGIREGDIMLISTQPCADNGDKVVALVDNQVTLKEFRKIDGTSMLIPRSTNPKNKPVILSEGCTIQGVVVKVFPRGILSD